MMFATSTFRSGPIVRLLADVKQRRFGEKQEFVRRSESRRAELLISLRERRDGLLKELLTPELLPASSREIVTEVCFYAERCEWNWFDLCAMLACMPRAVVDGSIVQKLSVATAVFQAFRMIDDVVDEHADYKGEYLTLLGVCRDRDAANPAAAALLPAVLMLVRVAEGGNLDSWTMQQAHATLYGALDESAGGCAGIDGYERIVTGKMVSYGMLLFGPALCVLEQSSRSSLEPFLESSFRVSQIANDLLDIDEDTARGQPNFWLLFDSVDSATDAFLRRFGELERLSQDVDPTFRSYSNLRVCDIAAYIASILNV